MMAVCMIVVMMIMRMFMHVIGAHFAPVVGHHARHMLKLNRRVVDALGRNKLPPVSSGSLRFQNAACRQSARVNKARVCWNRASRYADHAHPALQAQRPSPS